MNPHRIAGNSQATLGNDDIAAVNSDLRSIVRLRGRGFDDDGLLTVGGQCLPGHRCEAENRGKREYCISVLS